MPSYMPILKCGVIAGLVVLAGCPPRDSASDDDSDGGRNAIIQLEVLNVGQSPYRFGIDRRAAIGFATATAEDGGAITDLTPLLEPGDSFELPLSIAGTVTEVRIYAIPTDDADNVRGPYTCRFDMGCAFDGPLRAVWTGETFLSTGVDAVVLELVNTSTQTAYLLVDDETPALPNLPLFAGESRYVALPRAGTIAPSVEIRAIVFNPILGPTLAATGYCGVLGSCNGARVEFDGKALTCEAAQ